MLITTSNLTQQEQFHLSPSRAVRVLLEDERKSRPSTALFKVTIPQQKPLSKKKKKYTHTVWKIKISVHCPPNFCSLVMLPVWLQSLL